MRNDPTARVASISEKSVESSPKKEDKEIIEEFDETPFPIDLGSSSDDDVLLTGQEGIEYLNTLQER